MDCVKANLNGFPSEIQLVRGNIRCLRY